VVASGSFASPCGRVAGWDTVNWNCFASGVGIVGRDAIEYNGDLVVCGDFWNVNQPCTDCNGIARWDGTQWLPMGTGFNNDVLVLMKYGNDLLAAGDFTTADGNPCWRLARWDGNSWTPFAGITNAFDNEIRALAVYNGELWAGGDFVAADGCSTCNRIARFNGTNWVSTGIPNGVDSTVRALYVDAAENKIYMGGHFIEVAGDTNAKGIAVYDGVNWTPLSQGVYGKGQYVRAITKYNGDIIIGGYFSHVDFTTNAKRVARWNTFSLSWSNVGDGFTGGYIRTFEHFNGDLYAGGSFDSSGNELRPYIARWRDSTILTNTSDNIEDDNSFSVYPNPFNEELVINMERVHSAFTEAYITITDVTGKEVLHRKINSVGEILNTESFAAGLYFLKVESGGGVANFKIIKQE
jgi:trimeric autotransporter adhesin